ncbi:hypothetical protein CY34DRAFT_367545 [Suillus luteus UH-Slu-Lm8-n1]|uniref:Uncharacterized protein n=1 Tax=Suillus luteus UH-Slu-Lm8-n1 TaxID=930992 RepID=A0A0D0BAG4_9AGAM|nr:hypothetical protein CY34DRAFT_367545 [Suillus luteus UH-Slu-Lm8-n1]
MPRVDRPFNPQTGKSGPRYYVLCPATRHDTRARLSASPLRLRNLNFKLTLNPLVHRRVPAAWNLLIPPPSTFFFIAGPLPSPTG